MKSNLKKVTVEFISKDINVTKQVREDRIGMFRQNVLAINGKLFTKYPHIIKIKHD